MDCVVAYHFFHLAIDHGVYHYWYFGLTVTFVLLPSLTMTGFSLRWYLMDAENSELPETPTWKWILRIAVLLFQVRRVVPSRGEYFGQQEFQGRSPYAMGGHSENFRSLGPPGAEIWPFTKT